MCCDSVLEYLAHVTDYIEIDMLPDVLFLPTALTIYNHGGTE